MGGEMKLLRTASDLYEKIGCLIPCKTCNKPDKIKPPCKWSKPQTPDPKNPVNCTNCGGTGNDPNRPAFYESEGCVSCEGTGKMMPGDDCSACENKRFIKSQWRMNYEEKMRKKGLSKFIEPAVHKYGYGTSAGLRKLQSGGRRLMTSIPPMEPFDAQNFAFSVSALGVLAIGVWFLKRCLPVRKPDQPSEEVTHNDYEYLG